MSTDESNRLSEGGVIRAGVVGAGFFGTFHARKYAGLQGVELKAIIDPDELRAATLAEELSTASAPRLRDVLDGLDVVTVAAPALYHYILTKEALEAGKHVLVEKPIALKTKDADQLIALAADKNLVLQVGHQERFVFDAFGLLKRPVAPTEIKATRAGPFSGRAMDTSVVMDLMIHDLDLIHQVIPGNVAHVEAEARTVHGEHLDEVTAHLSFDQGAEVTLHASRIADDRDRAMSLVYPDGAIEIDFMNRTVKNTTGAELGDIFGADQPAVMADPLGFAVSHFIDSVRTKTEPVVTGRCGRQALETALKIHEAANATSGVAAQVA